VRRLSTRSTVATLTPAEWATSRIVIFPIAGHLSP
jgi:hypothetical protein